MTQDIRQNKPWTTDQISNDKPNAPRTMSLLSGWWANSFNGAHNKTIGYKKVMAGERFRQMNFVGSFKMLTPLTPTYQNLYLTFRTYFVPNIRVWDNAEKYTAQKGGTTENKIAEIPNIGGKIIPNIPNRDSGYNVPLSNTTIWRDSYISSYIPRIGIMYETDDNSGNNIIMPELSVLALRGRKAIFNDKERNKEYESEIIEYKGDTVSDQEWQSYLPTLAEKTDEYTMRAKKNNSYYSDYRLEMQGFGLDEPADAGDWSANSQLTEWAAWESKIAEGRSQAENAQANDWDVIAKIRGSKKLTEGKVQLLGERTVKLNYAAITQTSYNNNENINENFRVMGQQGAYSYTEVNVPLFAAWESVEEGYIHVIVTATADTVYESGLDRNELNIRPLDEYRPDLKDDKFDVLYRCELGTTLHNQDLDYKQVVGFKRKFSEYFKLPNIISGDMTNNNYYETKSNGEQFITEGQVITQKTFQFFEQDAELLEEFVWLDDDTDGAVIKKIWKDYSDIMINKNQAIKNQIAAYTEEEIGDRVSIRVEGQNQIFFVGIAHAIVDLPINEEIKTNYTKWGEH